MSYKRTLNPILELRRARAKTLILEGKSLAEVTADLQAKYGCTKAVAEKTYNWVEPRVRLEKAGIDILDPHSVRIGLAADIRARIVEDAKALQTLDPGSKERVAATRALVEQESHLASLLQLERIPIASQLDDKEILDMQTNLMVNLMSGLSPEAFEKLREAVRQREEENPETESATDEPNVFAMLGAMPDEN